MTPRVVAVVVDNAQMNKKNCELELPEAKANFLSVLSYHWISPLFWLGWKRTLEITDLWQLPSNWKTQSLVEGFEKAWELEKDAYEKELVEEPPEATEDKATEDKATKKKKQKSPLGTAVWNFMFW